MAALSADRETPLTALGVLPELPVKASTIIYAGSIVMSDGINLYPASNTAGDAVMGVAHLQVDNSGGAAGDKTVVLLSPVIAKFDAVETVRLQPGRMLYVVDDHTVGDVTTHLVKAGVCVQKISSTLVWILINMAATYV